MTPADRDAFGRKLAWLISLYPNGAPGPGTAGAYWELLRPYSWEAVSEAMDRALRQPEAERFFPTGPALRAIAEVVEKTLRPYSPPSPVRGLLAEPAATPEKPPRCNSEVQRMVLDWERDVESGQMNPQKLSERISQLVQVLGKSPQGQGRQR